MAGYLLGDRNQTSLSNTCVITVGTSSAGATTQAGVLGDAYLLVVSNSSTRTISTVVDSVGNTWSSVNSGTGNNKWNIYSCLNPVVALNTGATITITWAASATTEAVATVWGVSGGAGGTIDINAQLATSAGSTTLTGSTGTLAASNESTFAVGFMTSSTAPSSGSTPNTPVIKSSASGNYAYVGWAYTAPSTSSVTYTETLTASHFWDLIGVSLKMPTPTTYYLANAGSNSNSGTSSGSPWQTIAKINSVTLKPGDTVLFNGGDTFNDAKLYLPNSGSSSLPITIGSFGTGNPIFSFGTDDAIYAPGSNIVFQNLTVTGISGSTGFSGIQAFTSVASGSISISNCTLTGWLDAINIGCGTGGTYTSVTVTNCTMSSNIHSGMMTFGAGTTNSITTATISNCTSHDNTGSAANTTSASGFGFAIGGLAGGTISNCTAYNNGANNGDTTSGPVGIMVYDSTSVTVINCLAYNNSSGTASDGDGIDLDINCAGCVVEYCLSYGNKGAGILVWNNTSANAVRWNCCYGNSQGNSTGEIFVGSSNTSSQIYQNTCISTTAQPAIYLDSTGTKTGVKFWNNIMVATSTGKVMTGATAFSTTAVNFQGNLYYSTGTFGISWGGTNYTSESAWFTATAQETVSAANAGVQGNPLLNSLTTPTITSASQLTSANQFWLAGSTSPARPGKGLNLFTSFSVNPGTIDYFGSGVAAFSLLPIGASLTYVPVAVSSGPIVQRTRQRRSRALAGNNLQCGDGNDVFYTLVASYLYVTGGYISQRRAVQRPRAAMGSRGLCTAGYQGTVQPTYFVVKKYVIRRKPTQVTRAKVGPWDGIAGGEYGLLAPHGPPQQLASSAVPPRRKATRFKHRHVYGQAQPQPVIQPTATRLPRRTATRAIWHGNAGPQPGQAGSIQPAFTGRLPRRYPSRARNGILSTYWGAEEVSARYDGTVQSRATIPVPRRYPTRKRTLHVYGQVSPQGQVQPRATVPIPRRTRARAGFWQAVYGANQTFIPPGGTVQPPFTGRLPRRTSSRVITRWSPAYNPVPVFQEGQVQPTATRQPRRYPARALTRWSKPFTGLPAGHVQPSSTRQPRRTAARAVMHWSTPYLGHVNGFVQPTPTRQPRRTSARAGQWRAGYGGATILPSGSVQPRASVPVPRRYPSRAGFWMAVRGSVAIYTSGTVQKRATVPVPRRYPARAGFWAAVHGQPAPPVRFGSPPPCKGTEIARRSAARAVISTHQTPMLAKHGTVQPFTTHQPRRTAQRVLFHGLTRPAGIPLGTMQPDQTRTQPRRTGTRAIVRSIQLYRLPHIGHAQPRETVQIPRRYPSRLGTWHSAVSYKLPPIGHPQPRMTIPVSRRTRSRGLWNSLINPNLPVLGTVQPSVREPRRTVSRAIWHGIRSTILPTLGKVPPRSSFPVPRRKPSRASWHGIRAPFPKTGGPPPLGSTQQLVHRRTATRAAWNGLTVHTWPATGTARRSPALARRPASRAVWAYIASTLIPRTGHPQALTTHEPRRVTSRVVWHGLAGPIKAAGSPQPVPTRQPRRQASRVTWHGLLNRQQPPEGRPEQHQVIALPRRSSSRVTWQHVTGLKPHTGHTQPRATVTVPRRYPTGARWHGIAGATARRGTVQPQATRQPRRVPSRAVIQHLVTYTRPKLGRVQPLAAQPHRRGPARAVVRRHQGRFLATSSVNLAFNIYVPYTSSVNVAFNVGHGGQQGYRMLPSSPWISSYDARRKLVEAPYIPTQGGNA